MVGKIIQIIAEPDPSSIVILYGLDDNGNIWALRYADRGHVWDFINAQEK
jgi:hypothetical protein